MTEPSNDGPSNDGPSNDGPSNDATEWLIDAGDPLLTDTALARVADDVLPDRLAWNSFRTLALWNADGWAPALLEVACGEDNALSALNWDGAKVEPWAAGVAGGSICDVALDGPEAYVIVACCLSTDPSEGELRAALIAALDGSVHGGREAGFVVVVPPGAEEDMDGRIERAGEVELMDNRLAIDLLDGRTGWVEWPYLGRLALDLAEEGGEDSPHTEVVRRLVAELQERFPAAEL